MNQSMRGLSYLLTAFSQAFTIIIGAFLLTKELDVQHPLGFSWSRILIPVGVLVSFYNIYVILNAFLKLEKKKQDQEKESKKWMK